MTKKKEFFAADDLIVEKATAKVIELVEMMRVKAEELDLPFEKDKLKVTIKYPRRIIDTKSHYLYEELADLALIAAKTDSGFILNVLKNQYDFIQPTVDYKAEETHSVFTKINAELQKFVDKNPCPGRIAVAWKVGDDTKFAHLTNIFDNGVEVGRQFETSPFMYLYLQDKIAYAVETRSNSNGNEFRYVALAQSAHDAYVHTFMQIVTNLRKHFEVPDASNE